MSDVAKELDSVSRILCVDDERSVLMSLKRLLRGGQYDVSIAESGQEGLALIEKEAPFDLIISDMRMPEMDGAEFLATSVKTAPDSIRILLTGYADQEATVRAINDGKVFRYLHKPWDNDELKTIIEEAITLKQENDNQGDLNERLKNTLVKIKQESADLKAQIQKTNKLQRSKESILENASDDVKLNYRATIRAFANLINFRTKRSHHTAEEIVRHALAISKALELDKGYLKEIEHAAVLYPLGLVTFSDRLLEGTTEPMTPDERTEYEKYPIIGEQILAPIDALAGAAIIVRTQNENFDGTGYPDNLQGADIPIASRVIRLARDFNELLVDGIKASDALDQISSLKGKLYDPEIVDVYIGLMQDKDFSTGIDEDNVLSTVLSTNELIEGMIVSRDMYSSEGVLLLSKGMKIKDSTISKLMSFEQQSGEKFSICARAN